MASAQIDIRPYEPHQADLMYSIMMAAFEPYRGVLQPLPGALRETPQTNREALASGGGLIAWAGETAVGSARYELHPDHFYIGRLAVLPDWRGHGIGKALCLAMEPIARAHGHHVLRLGTRMVIEANVRLYQTLGYVIIDQIPYEGDNGYRAILEKHLSP
ncbi:MAG: GNAT family N-acetyltransferase [Pleurocapsa minor GSE-CHR-MK-17-07R]|nr:GNAT family N-acetyltransferase [Pleurocapsa minor GSE-CHR-MK 17-07R]